MILKRLSINFKKQDWFSVAVELCIVILGIYLGFQVTAWHSNQQAKVAESRLLMRLGEDLSNLQSQNTKVSERLDEQLKKVELALEFTRNADSWQSDHITWRKYLRPVMGYPDPVAELPVYEEIVATAQLSSIQNQSFRTALTRFAHQLDNTSDANKAFTTLYGSAYQNIFNHLVDVQEFPALVEQTQESRRMQLVRDLHTVKNTLTLVRIYTVQIVNQIKELRASLSQPIAAQQNELAE